MICDSEASEGVLGILFSANAIMTSLRLLFSVIFCLPVLLWAGTGTWTSPATGTALKYTTSEAVGTAAKDGEGKFMTVVYLENLSFRKIGQNTNAEDVAWLRAEGYRVIEIDYAHHEKAVSPYLNLDIQLINSALQTGSFCGTNSISADRAYILMEGYRLQRNVSYYLDDPTVYNLPDDYKTTAGDSLYLDLVYPSNPVQTVPVLISFSYSNSEHINPNKRMYLGYTFGAFKDSFLEGAAAVGMAWAICDHPKYCAWGNGKYTGGANKSLASVEVNPDACRKVKSAVRTVRGIGKSFGLNGEVAVTGFSRGSTAASLLVGDKNVTELEDARRGRFAEESSRISAAVLGPGVFNYQLMEASTNEYKKMADYVAAFPAYGWQMQGAHATIETKESAPVLFFYNSSDDVNYATQAAYLKGLLENLGVETALIKDYGTGHSVPQDVENLRKMYDFLGKHVTLPTTDLGAILSDGQFPDEHFFDLYGRPTNEVTKGLLFSAGHKIYRK